MRVRIGLLLLLSILPACGPRREEVGTTRREAHAATAARERDRLLFLGTVDGEVVEDYRDVAFGEGQEEPLPHVVTTGFAGGNDQGSVLLLGPDGERRAAYPCSGRTPYLHRDGRPLLQVQAPRTETLLFLGLDGRRLLTLTTHGSYDPASWVLLEAPAAGGLEERCRIWNLGHLVAQKAEGNLLAVVGYNGRECGAFAQYGTALMVVDLREALAATGQGEVVLPKELPPDVSVPAPVLWFVETPLDHPYGDGARGVEFRDGKVVSGVPGGLNYILDPATGMVTVEAGEGYRRDWGPRRLLQPELPADVEEHLRGLLGRVRVHGRR